MKQVWGIFVFWVGLTCTARAQDLLDFRLVYNGSTTAEIAQPLVEQTTDMVERNKALLKAEAFAAQHFFSMLMKIDETTEAPEASWIRIGRAVTQREVIRNDLYHLVGLLNVNFAYRNDPAPLDPVSRSEISQLILKAKLASDILPEPRFTDLKKSVSLALAEITGNRPAWRTLGTQAQMTVRTIERLIGEYEGNQLLVETQMPEKYMTQFRFLTRVQLLDMIQKTFGIYELSDADVELFLQDLAEGKYGFSKMHHDFDLFLNYPLSLEHRSIVPFQIFQSGLYSTLNEVVERGMLHLPVYSKTGVAERSVNGRSSVDAGAGEPIRLRVLDAVKIARTM